jgi:uncharacterized protein DUF6086
MAALAAVSDGAEVAADPRHDDLVALSVGELRRLVVAAQLADEPAYTAAIRWSSWRRPTRPLPEEATTNAATSTPPAAKSLGWCLMSGRSLRSSRCVSAYRRPASDRPIRDHVVVSQYFSIGDHDLWNPATEVAQLFYRTAGVMAALVDTPHGLHDTEQDEYHMEPAHFTAFVDALARRYLSSNHTVMRTLVEGFLATAVVLTQRAELAVPALAESINDDIARLLAHAQELDRTMVR